MALYFLVDKQKTAFKIGITENIEHRHAKLASAFGEFDLTLSCLLKGGRHEICKIEKTLHFILEEWRIEQAVKAGGHTEWFSMECFSKAVEVVNSIFAFKRKNQHIELIHGITIKTKPKTAKTDTDQYLSIDDFKKAWRFYEKTTVAFSSHPLIEKSWLWAVNVAEFDTSPIDALQLTANNTAANLVTGIFLHADNPSLVLATIPYSSLACMKDDPLFQHAYEFITCKIESLLANRPPSSCTIPTVDRPGTLALVQASYKLSLNEQRLVLACVAQLDSRKALPKDNLFTLTAADFAETYGIPVDQAYEALNEASHSLYERDIKVFDGKVKERFRWVYHVKYYQGESKVCLGFSQTIMPYLTLLNKQFTSYQMASVAKLRSIYSIRLYEFLIQYRSTGKLIIGLSDFKQRLELDGQYARFSNIKMRILNPAVKELQEKSHLIIDWRAIKKGRTVERLEFTFREEGVQVSVAPTPKSEKKIAANPHEKRIYGVTVSDIEKDARPGETYESAAMRIAAERKRAG